MAIQPLNSSVVNSSGLQNSNDKIHITVEVPHKVEYGIWNGEEAHIAEYLGEMKVITTSRGQYIYMNEELVLEGEYCGSEVFNGALCSKYRYYDSTVGAEGYIYTSGDLQYFDINIVLPETL